MAHVYLDYPFSLLLFDLFGRFLDFCDFSLSLLLVLNDWAGLLLTLLLTCNLALLKCLSDLFFASVWIIHQFLVDLQIAMSAQSSRMVRSVRVRTFGRLRLIAISYVALVAHEFGPMLSIVVGANFHQFEVFLHPVIKTKLLVIKHVDVHLVALIIKLLKELKFANTNCFNFPRIPL